MATKDLTGTMNYAEERSRCRMTSRGSSCTTSSWPLVVYAFLAVVFNDGCYISIRIFIPDFIFEFSSSATLMAWIFSLGPFMVGVMTPVAAYLSERLGARLVVMVSGGLAATGVMILSQAHHMAVVGVSIGLITSISHSTLFAAAVLLARQNFQRYYALAHGAVISGVSCGFFIFPPILEALDQRYSWRGACLIASGFMVQSMVMGALMKQRRFRSRSVSKKTGLETTGEDIEHDIITESDITLDDWKEADGIQGKITSKNLSKHRRCTMSGNAGVETIDRETQNDKNIESGISNDYNPEASVQIHLDVITSTKIKYSVETVSESNSKTPDAPFLKTVQVDFGGADRAITVNKSPQDSDSDNRHSSNKSLDDASTSSVSGVGFSPKPKCLRFFVARNYHTFALYTLSMFSTTVGNNIFLLHASNSFKEFGLKLQDIATSFSVYAACNLIGRFSNGLIVARLPPAYLLTVAEILAAVSILVVYLSPIFSIRGTAVGVYGITSGVITSLFYVYHREIVDPEVDVKTLSIFMIIEGLAAPVGGSFGGLLRDATGAYRMTYFTAAGLPLLASALMVVIILLEKRRKRRKH